jgi:hypothetical protein
VDEKHNSAYPYVIGPTFYGVYANRKVTSVSESTITYNPAVSTKDDFFEKLQVHIFPNPAAELIALQLGGLLEEDITIQLSDISGKAIETKTVYKGQTIAYFEVEILNPGTYIITLSNGRSTAAHRVMINR